MDFVFKGTEEGLVLPPEKKAREGWEQKFQSRKRRVKRKRSPLLGEFPNEFDQDEWKNLVDS